MAIRTLGPASQALVIHILHQGNRTRDFASADLAARLGYSAMTVTRALNELESVNLGEVFRNGRDRWIRFAESPRDTWAKALPFLRSPVTKRIHVETLHGEPPGICAGLSALAQCTMLAQPDHPILALSKEEWGRISIWCYTDAGDTRRNALPAWILRAGQVHWIYGKFARLKC